MENHFSTASIAFSVVNCDCQLSGIVLVLYHVAFIIILILQLVLVPFYHKYIILCQKNLLRHTYCV